MKYPQIILLSLFFSLFSCSKSEDYHKSQGMIWNTSYHITYKGSPILEDSIIPVLKEVESALSIFDANSLVSQLNSQKEIKADKHLIVVYDTSKKIHQLSDGNFDPTVSPLIDAWGFGIGHTPSSDTLAVDSILTFIGIDKTQRKADYILKDDIRTRFNFSAIAKGYGCDAVGEMFRRNGVSDYMIEIGGEIALSGKSPKGTDWRIGVDAPVDDIAPGEESLVILSLTDVGVATSGNYRNYWIENGNKIAHTISPKTGRPVIGEILSATVVANTCMEADAIATACMASSLNQAKNLLSVSGAEALLVLTDSVWISPGFKKFITSEVSVPE